MTDARQNADPPAEEHNLIDIAVKRLVRDNPAAFLQLAGISVAPERVRFEDTAIQQRERRADHVCLRTDEAGNLIGVIDVEYQLIPDARVLRDWVWKWSGLLERFSVPVVMLVVYLQRGRFTTFPDRFLMPFDGLTTQVLFNTLRLWEHGDAIRSGAYPDFVPLLTLCEDEPDEATVREQVRLIEAAELSGERKRELLSLSLLVASRDVGRAVMLAIAREVFGMESLETLPPIVEDLFGAALRERDQEREARGREIGEARGREVGEVQGALREARAVLVRLGTRRLGPASPEVLARLGAIDNLVTLDALIDRLDEPDQSWERLLPPAG